MMLPREQGKNREFFQEGRLVDAFLFKMGHEVLTAGQNDVRHSEVVAHNSPTQVERTSVSDCMHPESVP